MFAGPNGSGKSTLKSYLPQELLGVYLNADDMEEEIRKQGFLNLESYGIRTTAGEVLPFFTRSSFLQAAGFSEAAASLAFVDGKLFFERVEANSYFASVAADFLRQRLLEQRVSFTFETVMSHASKVDLLAQAQTMGYRTYLYYVATDDETINISRVRNRVKLGGHPVPEDLIVKRYHRSLGLLREAIRHTNRAYIFDNSGDNESGKHTWLAEITEGEELVFKTATIPAWFVQSLLSD